MNFAMTVLLTEARGAPWKGNIKQLRKGVVCFHTLVTKPSVLSLFFFFKKKKPHYSSSNADKNFRNM